MTDHQASTSWEPAAPRLVAPLVDAGWLMRHRSDVVVLQVDEDSTAYYEGHLPGALALASYDDPHEQVRRAPIDRGHFEELMQSRGIEGEDHVVLYSSTSPGAEVSGYGVHAAFAYWVMHWYDHRRISLLDGGQDSWTAAGSTLTAAAPATPQVGPYRVADPHPQAMLRRDEVLADYVGEDPEHLMLDCRTHAEHEGRAHHQLDVAIEHHRVRGHIPGALDLPSIEVLDGSMVRD